MLWDAGELTQAQSWDWDVYYSMAGTGTTGGLAVSIPSALMRRSIRVNSSGTV